MIRQQFANACSGAAVCEPYFRDLRRESAISLVSRLWLPWRRSNHLHGFVSVDDAVQGEERS